MYIVMLMPVETVAIPRGPMLTVFWGNGAGAERTRVRWRRGRRGRVRGNMVTARVWGGLGKIVVCYCAFFRGREGLEGDR